jgi:hypothetical protein
MVNGVLRRLPASPREKHDGTDPASAQPFTRRRLGLWLGGALTAVLVGAAAAWLGPGGLLSLPDGQQATPQPTGTPGIPFTVASTAEGACADRAWVIPQAPGAFPTPPTTPPTASWKPWAERLGGVQAGITELTFTIQGRTNAEVTLTDLAVNVLSRGVAASGTDVGDGCGGDSVFRWAGVDLDADPPAIRLVYNPFNEPLPSNVPPHELRPIKFPYTVALADAENFKVLAVASRCDCTWEIQIKWTSQGASGVYTIDDGGRPFHTMGTANVKSSCLMRETLECGRPVR